MTNQEMTVRMLELRLGREREALTRQLDRIANHRGANPKYGQADAGLLQHRITVTRYALANARYEAGLDEQWKLPA